MTIVTHTRRVARRYAISQSHQARLEFQHPSPGGRHFDFPLIDISVSGLSFNCGDALRNLEGGSTLPSVVIRLGNCEIHGDLLVMHVTPHSPSVTVCGALFYPAKDADLTKLKSAIAGITAVIGD